MGAFFVEHEAALAEMRTLEENLRETQDAVKALLLKHKDTVGDRYHGFAVKPMRSVDAARLVELLPEAIELVKFTITVAELDKHVASGLISSEMAEDVTIETLSVAAPRR